ncbi:DUF262 domain-containing protein [Tropicibacter sp. R15_0]|uniref:DUF262 domain-containing protein n=1 Tax=Tropicibacter sp. R15_0 TaxID=2821101 RepID=UPI001AD9C998|nr:DUF262 domain-containing protein [Tropicibacter sp. R15_0]MBO9465921.1 DUF262 domain-containing protein [Tropicibacter sp. R15_0]
MTDIKARDPKPDIDRVEELAQRVFEGDILLPKFQRDFVWNKSQVLALFDSIAKNYPIGSILLWLSKQKLRSETNIAGLPFKDRAEEYPVNYLLDGQQRLSCICGAIYWSPIEGEEDSIWNVAYDLKSKKFLHLQALDEPPLHQIRLNKLPDASAFFTHVAALEASDGGAEQAAEAKRFFNLFKSYSVASVTLHDMPIEDVAPIFERINSTGTKLTIVDLMRAATWSAEFDLVDTIDEKVLEAVAEKGFDSIDRKAVLRVLSSASGFSFSTSGIDRLRNCSVDELKIATDDTVSAFKLATDFLHDQLHLPNAKIVPYVNQIVVLAEFFRLKPTISAAETAVLKRWFWRTTLSNYFSGWSSGQMDADLEALKEFADGQTETLEIGTSKPTANIWKNRTFRANTSASKLLGLLLTQSSPADLVTGQHIKLSKALAWQNNREYHHIFPKAFLAGQGFKPSQFNSLANFALLSSSSNKLISDRRPSDYLPECAQKLGDQFEAVLRSNIISEAAYEFALQDDYEGFRDQRAQDLHSFALQLSDWDN